MKKTIIAVLFVSLTLSAFSQRQDRKEHIRALKIAHITDKLDLSEKEAQLFWPIYNTFDKQTSKIKFENIRALRHEIRQNYNTLTDAEANDLLDQLLKAENQLHNKKIQLVEKLQKILSPKKIMLLKMAEEDFNRKLFNEMRKRKEQFRKQKP